MYLSIHPIGPRPACLYKIPLNPLIALPRLLRVPGFEEVMAENKNEVAHPCVMAYNYIAQSQFHPFGEGAVSEDTIDCPRYGKEVRA
jgi:hypothetical protein